MSKAKLEKAQVLLQKKRYAEARRILETMPRDATAKKWLARLDEIAPAPKKPRRRALRYALYSIGLLLVVYVVTGGPQQTAERNATRTSVAMAAQTHDVGTATAQQFSRDRMTATADANATNIALTPSATPTITPTPSITPLPTATGTATSTLPPSATVTTTNTALPTLTPAPTEAAPEVWYTVSTANLRACSRLDCAQITQLPGGTQITVVGWVQGEIYKNSDIWRRVSYNGQEAYVHSSLVSVDRPAPTSAPIVIQQGPQSTMPPNPVIAAPQQWNCSGDIYNCGDFKGRHSDLMSYWNACPGDPSRLDQGGQPGVPCESN